MDTQTIEEAIIDKLKSMLEISDWQIGEEEDLGAYGLNSLRTIQLVVELEQHFNITFEDDEMLGSNFSTLKALVDRVASKLQV